MSKCVGPESFFKIHSTTYIKLPILGAKNVKILPDGSGEFTRKMGMLVSKDNLGYGMRSWRYSMYVEDGNIQAMFIEPGLSDNCVEDPFEVSDADTMLNFLKGRK